MVYYLVHLVLIAAGFALTFLGLRGDATNEVNVAIGTSLVASGLAGFVIFFYVAAAGSTQDALKAFGEQGLTKIFPKRARQIREEYSTRLSRASRYIDIIGFGLSDFRVDYIDELENLAGRARVRILLIDPNSPYADQRDYEEGQSVGTIAKDVNDFISQYQQRFTPPPPNLELRLYSSLPHVNIFRIDNDLFWGPYLSGKASANTVTMLVRRGGDLYDTLIESFEDVWNNHSRQP